MIVINRTGTALWISLTLLNPIARSQSILPDSFLVEPNRPMVYLTVDHVGFGGFEGGVRKRRVWLRFQNNCHLPIDLHVSGAPTDAPDDRLTVMYELIKPIERGVEVTETKCIPSENESHHPQTRCPRSDQSLPFNQEKGSCSVFPSCT